MSAEIINLQPKIPLQLKCSFCDEVNTSKNPVVQNNMEGKQKKCICFNCTEKFKIMIEKSNRVSGE